MRHKVVLWAILASSLLIGCSGAAHIIGYDIIKASSLRPSLGAALILPFTDQRPQEERLGLKGKLLTFSSRDKHFNQPPHLAIPEVLAKELENSGFSISRVSEPFDYQISGAVKHFQALASPAKITFLPYLGSLSTLWAKDDFVIALSIYIKMTDSQEQILIDKTFDVSSDLRLPTGLLNLARYSRGFNYKLKLLDEALKNVIAQIRDEVIAQAKK